MVSHGTLRGITMVTKNQQKMAATGPLQQEANEYLKQHKIPQLFEELTAELVFHRPSDPRSFMRDYILKLQNAKANPDKGDPPSLLDESNIRCVFSMLDITKRGFITTAQYHEAMRSVGVQIDYNKDPNGVALNKISQETFIRETKTALRRACSTFSADY